MAQIYFEAQDAERISSLQNEIQQKQVEVDLNLAALDDAGAKQATETLGKLQEMMIQLVKTSARIKKDVTHDFEAIAAAYKETIDMVVTYLAKRDAILNPKTPAATTPADKAGTAAAEPAAPPANEADKQTQLQELDTKFVNDFMQMPFPNLNETYDAMLEKLNTLREQVASSGKSGSDLQLAAIDKASNAIGKLKTASKGASFIQMGSALGDFSKKAGEAGTAVGELGTALGAAESESVEMIQQIFSTIQGVVGGIGSIVSAVGTAMQVSSSTAVGSIKAVEMASVILAVITAVIQIATAIANLFNQDKQYEKLQKESEQFKKQLEFIEKNRAAVAIEDQVHAVDVLADAYKRCWMSIEKCYGGVKGDRKISASLRENKAVVDQLISKYSELDYMIGKSLGEEKYESARGQLENLAAQQKELYIQLNAEQNKKKSDDGAIKEYEQNIQKLGAEMQELLSKLTEDIIGGSAEKIAGELGGAFIEAFQNGENAAQAWKDKVDDLVADIVKRMLIQQLVEPAIGGVFNKYKKLWFDDGNFLGFDGIIGSMDAFKNDMNDASGKLAEFFKKVKEDPEFMEMLGVTDTVKGGSSSSGFETMSQETAGELNGRFTDIQAKATGILGLTSALNFQSMSMLEMQTSARNIAAETRDFAVQGFLQLTQIAENTAAVVLPIRNMAEQLDNISLRIKEL